MKIYLSKTSLTSLLAVVAFAASAQTWPTQTIKIIVPFTAGTGMDTIARAVAPKLSDKLGQPVIVQNMAGASGNIGADAVAKASPDGYTLMMGANTMLMASQLYKNVPFNPTKDFSPVSLAAWGTLMMVSSPKTGIKTVNDLVTQAKAKPGYINFGSPGIGTPHHMAMELFKVKTNLFMLHVPYRGTAGYTQDILSGEIMVGFLPVHIAQGFVNVGKLNALAVGSPKRHPVAPSVATFGELGIKDIEVDLWYAFFAPNKMSEPIVNRLNAEISGILKQPEITDLFKRAGMDANTSTPDELTQLVNKDYPRWGEVIRRNGITAE